MAEPNRKWSPEASLVAPGILVGGDFNWDAFSGYNPKDYPGISLPGQGMARVYNALADDFGVVAVLDTRLNEERVQVFRGTPIDSDFYLEGLYEAHKERSPVDHGITVDHHPTNDDGKPHEPLWFHNGHLNIEFSREYGSGGRWRKFAGYAPYGVQGILADPDEGEVPPPVYIHCHQGVNRSTSMALYMILADELLRASGSLKEVDPIDAFLRIRHARPQAGIQYASDAVHAFVMMAVQGPHPADTYFSNNLDTLSNGQRRTVVEESKRFDDFLGRYWTPRRLEAVHGYIKARHAVTKPFLPGEIPGSLLRAAHPRRRELIV